MRTLLQKIEELNEQLGGLKQKNEDFNALVELLNESGKSLEYDKQTNSNKLLENFVFSHSKPITYKNMQNLI